MNSHISNTDHLTADDIAGAQALYGATAAAASPAGRRQCRGVVSAARRVVRLPQPARGQVPRRASPRSDLHRRRHRRRHRVDVRIPALPRVSVHAPAGRRPRRWRKSTATRRRASAATRSPARCSSRRATRRSISGTSSKRSIATACRRGPTSTTVDREGDVVWIAGVPAVPREQLRPRRRRAERAHADRRPLRAAGLPMNQSTVCSLPSRADPLPNVVQPDDSRDCRLPDSLDC